MECNKDDAIKAKEIAEKKFAEMDTTGAKKVALKAQNLYPTLQGLAQFIATLDVYISAEKKLCGEADWYGVLGVKPTADDDTIRRRYRKLALILHPDKNKSVGADGAFKIVSEAWSLLSDESKRSKYDQKRNSTTSEATGRNSFCNSDKSGTSVRKNSTAHFKPTIPAPKPLKPTFWTLCKECKMQFEYFRIYINNKLRCPNCSKSFRAVEIPNPPLNANHLSTPWRSNKQQQSSDPYNNTNKKSCSGGKTATSVTNLGKKMGKEEMNQAATKDKYNQRKTHASKKSGDVGGLANGFSNMSSNFVAKEDGHGPKKKRRVEANNSTVNGSENQMSMGNGGVSKESTFESQKCNRSSQTGKTTLSRNNACRRELSQFEIRNMLIEKAKHEIWQKIKEWKADGTFTNSHILESADKEEKKILDSKKGLNNKKDYSPNSKGTDPLSMTVPDPDFHDFDKDRTEYSFGNNQVWAVYDDDDGMPRYYAMVHNRICIKPFKIRISWLNSKNNNEFAPLNWIGCGFPKTGGEFWIGKHEMNNFLNSFSHRVKHWTKGSRGAIQIYPQKGDVWALYTNWSSDWNELTPDKVVHKYDMVEVLEDYSEEKGVTVVPLVKVSGFKTVFQKHLDPSKIRRVPREEMFRFSHQVPSHLLTGLEGHNAPVGFLELDPAATPLELLLVGKNARNEESGEKEAAKDKKNPMKAGNKGVEKMIVYSRKRFKRRGKMMRVDSEISSLLIDE